MSISKEMLSNFMNPTFIETGTHEGEAVSFALELGFKFIKTIEARKEVFQIVKKKFNKHPNINFYFGESTQILPLVLLEIQKPATFWLDAHFAKQVECELYNTPTKSTVLRELEIISQHHLKNHTILIDDVRLFGLFGLSIAEVEKKLRSINPNYTIYFIDGRGGDRIFTQDILVAEII